MELYKILFEDNNIEVVEEQFVTSCIASIHNKTDKDIVIKFGSYNVDDIEIEANGWQDLFDDLEDFTVLGLLVNARFGIVQQPSLEALNEEILSIVKSAINNNARIDFASDCIKTDSNGVDHIAEEVAEEVCKLIAKGEN